MNPFFTGVGSLQNSLRSMKMEMLWKQRSQNPQQKKEKLSDDPEIARKQRELERFQQEAANARKGNIISGLDAKLKAGNALSDEEMAYLKANNPELYQEAVKIRQEREQYKRELEGCRTQEDVDKLKSRKLQGFLNESKTIMQNPNIPKGKKVALMDQILRRLMMVEQEHRVFLASSQYQTLPADQEELKGEGDRGEAAGKPTEGPDKPDASADGDGAEPAPETPGETPPAPDKGKPAETADPAGEIRRMAASLGGAEPGTEPGTKPGTKLHRKA